MATEQLLIEQEDVDIQDTIFTEATCSDCDCLLEISYTDEGRRRFYCDNCDSFVVSGSTAIHGIAE